MRSDPVCVTHTKAIWHAAGALAAVLFAAWAAPRLLDALAILLFSVTFGLVLDAPVSALERHKVPRPLATLLVVTVVLAGFVGLAVVALPPVVDQASMLLDDPDRVASDLAIAANRVGDALPFDVQVTPDQVDPRALFNNGSASRAAMSTGHGVTILAISFFTAMWAVASPNSLASRLLSFFPHRRRHRVAAVTAATVRTLRSWLIGQMILCASIGVGTWLILTALGVRYAALFALLAAFCEAIPTYGVLLAGIPPALTILSSTEPRRIIWFLLAVAVLQQLEDRALVPLVMRRSVNVHPALIGVALVIGGSLFGMLGLIFAVPLMGTVFALLDEFQADAQPAPVPAELPPATP